jgi:hypothetical protein
VQGRKKNCFLYARIKEIDKKNLLFIFILLFPSNYNNLTQGYRQFL